MCVENNRNWFLFLFKITEVRKCLVFTRQFILKADLQVTSTNLEKLRCFRWINKGLEMSRNFCKKLLTDGIFFFGGGGRGPGGLYKFESQFCFNFINFVLQIFRNILSINLLFFNIIYNFSKFFDQKNYWYLLSVELFFEGYIFWWLTFLFLSVEK